MKRPYTSKLAKIFAAVAVLTLTLGTPSIVSATCGGNQESCTSNYGVSETHFGSGGQLCIPGSTGSANYCASSSVGDLADGNSASANYQTQAGSGLTTSREPYLQVSVGGTPYDAGTLSVGSTTTATATFSVKTYLASGYVVQIYGNPPTSSGAGAHTFTALSSPASPTAGQEQFGINLVSNTTSGPACSSVNVGANPLQVPDSTFSFGQAADVTQNANGDYYNTCGKFAYHSGDVIAYSTKSSGETDYTISFIYNISNLTPDGQYIYNGSVVATSTF